MCAQPNNWCVISFEAPSSLDLTLNKLYLEGGNGVGCCGSIYIVEAYAVPKFGSFSRVVFGAHVSLVQ